MNNSKQSFLDPKTLVAVLLVGASWLGWQSYMRSKYPHVFEKKAETAAGLPAELKAAPEVEKTPVSSQTEERPQEKKQGGVLRPPESFVEYSGEQMSFRISSRGMGFKNIQLNQFRDRAGKVKSMGFIDGEWAPFATGELGQAEPYDFEVKRIGENEFHGVAQIGTHRIIKTVSVEPATYSTRTRLEIENPAEDFKGFHTELLETVTLEKAKSFLLPALDHEEFYVVSDGTSHRTHISHDENTKGSEANSQIATIGSQYFVQGLINRASVLPTVNYHSAIANSSGRLSVDYPILNRGASFAIEYITYVGPKSLHLLKSIDPEFAGVINFGIFGFIGTYILKLMVLFHDWVGNWGVSIILLTLLVRLIVLPFNVMSYKSMKAMQTIQPHLKELREKHKDDSQRLSVETMALMRTHKVNPLGGCLPVFLQLPIFWALYQVLGQSIELYQAPFVLWITDLSLKDPYYVLPVLMGVTLFFQQKMTPNTMEPAQRKILMFMPILFSFFMISLPSGLTLYIFISGLFGVTQQYYFMRDRHAVALAHN